MGVVRAISRNDLKQMRELGVKGRLTEERLVDSADWPNEELEAEIVHLTDVVEMQALLLRAADELERLYGSDAAQ